MALTTTQKTELGQMIHHKLKGFEQTTDDQSVTRIWLLTKLLALLDDAGQETLFDELLEEQITAVDTQRGEVATNFDANLELLRDRRRVERP